MGPLGGPPQRRQGLGRVLTISSGNVRFRGKAVIGRSFRRIGSPVGSARYFFVIIVIRYETTAAARWALLLIVRTLFNDAITVAVWTGFGFHLCLPVGSSARLTRQERQFSSMLASLIIFPQTERDG